MAGRVEVARRLVLEPGTGDVQCLPTSAGFVIEHLARTVGVLLDLVGLAGAVEWFGDPCRDECLGGFHGLTIPFLA